MKYKITPQRAKRIQRVLIVAGSAFMAAALVFQHVLSVVAGIVCYVAAFWLEGYRD